MVITMVTKISCQVMRTDGCCCFWGFRFARLTGCDVIGGNVHRGQGEVTFWFRRPLIVLLKRRNEK
jgi:hypothetical protein